ncbi:MAG: hypothetical protein K9K66_01975 [Desulfarculaceae bacterium]|nr:hypothetical protein [Desulfarculaceae bacterium]MCF8073451.1 hypothetical protein [Desulfarculaceae bacterium]MCF8100402.1 hypothetical protein [Desulfarculaceae bacterium]MCF8115862.1 hypothetical protein [Desulfarculaceae bacterium]
MTTALRHKGLVPKPPGQAYLLVRASFDAKRPANPEGSEPKQSGAIKYEFKFHLAAFKAGGSQRAAWQGWATHPDTYQNVLNTLYAMIVAVVSHWGEPSQRRDWTGVSRDNPMYLLLNQGP